MILETAKDKICINQIIGQKKETTTIEGDVIVNDVKPDVLNVISSSGTVLIYKKEVMDGKVRLDGNINAYIIYLADNETGDIRSLNTVLDFTHFMDIENCSSGMFLDEEVKIRNFDCNILNSRKINVKAMVEIDAKVLSNEDIDIISKIDDIGDIQTLKTRKQC